MRFSTGAVSRIPDETVTEWTVVRDASVAFFIFSKSSFVNFAFVGRRESATSPTTVSCCLIGAKIYPKICESEKSKRNS